MNEHDPVDHPSHYTQGAVECIDAIEAALGEEGFIAFLRGQIMKYTWRLGLKGPATEDVGKIAWYTERLAGALDHLEPAELPARESGGPWEYFVPELRRDWRPITAEEVKRARDLYRQAVPFNMDQARPRYATRVYDLDGNMRLTYPPFEFNWDAITPGNDWVARDPCNGDVYSYSWKPVYVPRSMQWMLDEDAPDEADVLLERGARDALPDGVFLIERVPLHG